MSKVSSFPGMASFRLAAAAFLIASLGLAAKPVPVLTYSTNPNYPPYDWAEDETSFQGASIELLSMLLPPGVEARPVVVPWKRALALAAEHKVDLILSVRDTPERRGFLEFMRNPAFPNPIAVFVRRDHAFPFRTWEDLKGKRGGVSLGDTFGGGFDPYWHEQLQVEEAPSLEENFRKLVSGRIDYFVSGLYLGESYIANQGLDQDLAPLPLTISNEDIYFAFSRNSPCLALKPYMERRLKELNRKGIPMGLLRKQLAIYAHKGPAGRPALKP
jgi:polar amino acid transport system substrate-binding protein